MPPKKKTSSKKGRKMTKAQKAKQQQEEEERKLREEEEAKVQAEREEEERVERERKDKEREILELKDLERREIELNELRFLLENNHTAVQTWKTDAAEKAEWEKYMRCDGTPDPAAQQEINTYISSWRDDPEVNLTSVLKQCNLALQLVEELKDHLIKATDPQHIQRYQESVTELQELIHFKHLLTAEEILKKASLNIDTETGNMQTVFKDDIVTLCLWASIKANPRFKGQNFEEVGLGFELPKQLAVGNIAVRILHTHYDHLSLLARITHMRIRTPSHRSLAGHSKETEEINLPDDGDIKEKVEENSEQQKVEDERSVSVLSRRSSPPPAEGEESQIQTQMEALRVKGDLISPSVHLSKEKMGVQVVDLMQYTPLGGVFYCDVFHLPPQTHCVNGWEIQLLSDTGLQVYDYPNAKSSEDGGENLPSPLVGVSLTLPDSVAFLETPQVARWDAAGKQWRMDGITDVSYVDDEAKLSFKMDSFQALVLLQETYVNFPFQRWELRPLGNTSAIFTINGALLDLSITVQDNQCMLQSDKEKGLSHLVGKWMSCSALQNAMQNAGVNVFVDEHTDKFVSNCGKDPLTEHSAYEQMALFSSACAFSWSKWNAKCGAEYVVLQACEHLDSEPVPQGSWSRYLVGAQRGQKLAITERSEAFSSDYQPGSEIHSTFIHMLQDNMSPGGIERSESSHYLFIDTVQSLLCATRPLMYS